MEVIDEALQIGLVGALEYVPQPRGEDADAQGGGCCHEDPEDDEEGLALAVREDAHQDRVAVEGKTCFLDLWWVGK